MNDIDREVTEEIFEECWHDWMWTLAGSQYCYQCTKCHEQIFGETFNPVGRTNIPHSTSWEAMGRLIEKMRELGYLVLLQQAPRPDAKAFCGLQDRQKNFEALANTLPMAVAVAALKAKRGER